MRRRIHTPADGNMEFMSAMKFVYLFESIADHHQIKIKLVPPIAKYVGMYLYVQRCSIEQSIMYAQDALLVFTIWCIKFYIYS